MYWNSLMLHTSITIRCCLAQTPPRVQLIRYRSAFFSEIALVSSSSQVCGGGRENTVKGGGT
jgi:hypothetical protein